MRAFVALAVAVFASLQVGPINVDDDKLVGWVDTQVAGRQPRAEDRRFDEIGWVADIRTAQRLAKEHSRPVFLFTHDGRMNLGRC